MTNGLKYRILFSLGNQFSCILRMHKRVNSDGLRTWGGPLPFYYSTEQWKTAPEGDYPRRCIQEDIKLSLQWQVHIFNSAWDMKFLFLTLPRCPYYYRLKLLFNLL